MIVFLDQTGELGGAELSLLDIVKSRVDASRVILFSDGPFRQRLAAAGTPVTVIAGDAIFGVRRRSGLFAAMKSAPALAALVWRVAARARSAEILYANTQKAFVVAALAGILARRPVVWHLHDILSSEHFSGAMRAITVRLANAKAACVIANSKASADAFRQAGGKAPLRVVYNGIDPAPFDAVDPSLARARLCGELGVTTAPLVGVFGRLAEWKGQHIVIEALKGLPKLHAVLVGGALFGEAQYEARLRRQAIESGLSGRVHFLGFRDDVPAIMKAVDIVVHASVAPEPFGRVIVEGMLAGKPVIATRAGGVLEIIEDGVTGLLAPPGDVAALEAAIRRLLAEPELAKRLADRGRAEANRRFSLKSYASSVETVCKSVFNDGRSRENRCELTGVSGPSVSARRTTIEAPTVVFLDQTGELGGGELSLLDIVKSRVDASQVILFSDGPFRQRLAAAGTPVTVIAGDAIFGVRRGSGLFAAMKSAPALAALVWRVAARARSAEILYANSQKAFVVAALAGVLARRPVVWHLRDILSSQHFSGVMRAITVRLANAKAACVIANSKASADAFRQAGGKAPLRVVYNGIDPAPFDAVDSSLARARLCGELGVATAPLVGVFGRLAEWKGQHIVVEALKGLPNLHAVLVGGALFGEAQYEARLRRQAVESDLSGRVHFLGFRDDVPAIMKAVDIVVHASVAPEPFGRVIVEGMLAGKPVIATRAGGVLEIIEDGVTGLLAPPGDVAALEAAIRRLLAEPELAKRLADRGRAEANRRFSLKSCLSSVETVNASVRDYGDPTARVPIR